MTSYRKVLRRGVLRLHFFFTKMALVPCGIRLKSDEVSSRKLGGSWGQDSEDGGHRQQSESGSVVSESLRPHGLYSPRNSPGQNTGVGSLSLLQGIFPTQGLNPGLPHCRRIFYQLSHQGSCGLNDFWERKSLEKHEQKKGN